MLPARVVSPFGISVIRTTSLVNNLDYRWGGSKGYRGSAGYRWSKGYTRIARGGDGSLKKSGLGSKGVQQTEETLDGGLRGFRGSVV